MAVEPLSVFYASQRLTETPFTLLLCMAMVALHLGRFWPAALILSVSVLVRPTLDLLAPLLMVVFAVLHAAAGRKPQAAVRSLAIYALVYALVMAPWWVHNAVKYDRFVRLNLGDGIVLRVEHNRYFEQFGFWSKLRPVFEEFAEERDPVRINALRREAALQFIAADPARYVRMSVQRFLRFWSPVMDQDEENRWFPDRARPLFFVATLLLYAGAVAYALQRRQRKWRRIAPLLLVIGYLTAVHTAMHAVVRYRTPLMPLVVVIAGAGWRRLASDAVARLGARRDDDAAAPRPVPRERARVHPAPPRVRSGSRGRAGRAAAAAPATRARPRRRASRAATALPRRRRSARRSARGARRRPARAPASCRRPRGSTSRRTPRPPCARR
jgi:hypothetical protein